MNTITLYYNDDLCIDNCVVAKFRGKFAKVVYQSHYNDHDEYTSSFHIDDKCYTFFMSVDKSKKTLIKTEGWIQIEKKTPLGWNQIGESKPTYVEIIQHINTNE
jgi:hypothetical protein